MRFPGDLSGVSHARATELLAEFGRVVEGELRKYAAVVLQGLDYDDLRAVAHIAVLEASMTHQAERRGLKGWVRQTIRWRLAEVVEGHQPDVDLTDTPEDFPNGRNPYEVLEAVETEMWVKAAVGQLSPRRRTIVAATMAGETVRQIGPTLGISKTRVGQERKRAFETLRHQALEAGLVDE